MRWDAVLWLLQPQRARRTKRDSLARMSRHLLCEARGSKERAGFGTKFPAMNFNTLNKSSPQKFDVWNNFSEMLREMQVRLVYSFLKPAIRAAARFSLPIKTLVDLVRLAYFEHLSRAGMSPAEVARIFDQTARHMRSLAQRLEGDFFTAERSVGLVREVEELVAKTTPEDDAIVTRLSSWPAADVHAAIQLLLHEKRIVRRAGGELAIAERYHLMSSDQFHHRIDSLNHLLDGTWRAVLHRLLFDDKKTALMKTLTFSAIPAELEAFVKKLEARLRVEVAALDENATFQGKADNTYTMALTLAPRGEP